MPRIYPATAMTVVAILLPIPAAATQDRFYHARLLPVYIAQNFAAVCSADSPSFARETSGSLGTIHTYAQHVKDEVSRALPAESAASIMRLAADDARIVARRQLKKLSSPDEQNAAEALKNWCTERGKHIVLGVIGVIDSNHDALLRETE